MAETQEPVAPVADFEAYLAERNLTLEEHQALPEEMRQYIWEAWQWEHHVIAPLSEDAEEESPTESPHSAIVFEQELSQASPVLHPSLATLPIVILGGVLVLVTLTAILLGFRSKRSSAPESAPTSANPPSTVALPAVTGSARPGWQIVGKAERQAVASLPVTVIGPKWRILWNTRQGDRGTGDFNLLIKRSDGRIVDQNVHIAGEGEGELVLRDPGEYKLEITASEIYQVKVFDFR